MSLNPFKKPKPNQALIRSGIGKVITTSSVAIKGFSLLHLIEAIDLSERKITIKRDKQWPLLSKDKVKLYGEAHFTFCIVDEGFNLRMIAQSIGPKNTFDQKMWEKFMYPKFNEALEVIIGGYTVNELFNNSIDWHSEMSNYLHLEYECLSLVRVNIELQKPKALQL